MRRVPGWGSKGCSRPSSCPDHEETGIGGSFLKRGWIIGQRHRDQRGILRRYAIGFEHLERWNAGSAAGRPSQDALALELREPVDLFRAAVENPNWLGYQAAHRMQVGRVDAVGEAALHEARLDIGVRVLEEPEIVHGRRGLPHLDLDAFFCRLFLDAERQPVIGAGLARRGNHEVVRRRGLYKVEREPEGPHAQHNSGNYFT